MCKDSNSLISNVFAGQIYGTCYKQDIGYMHNPVPQFANNLLQALLHILILQVSCMETACAYTGMQLIRVPRPYPELCDEGATAKQWHKRSKNKNSRRAAGALLNFNGTPLVLQLCFPP
jgi:hypothetical protein